jgi:hypothetical protein
MKNDNFGGDTLGMRPFGKLARNWSDDIEMEVTPWSTVLLEKLIVAQLIKKFPAFYGTRRFILPCSQEPATGTCPELHESSPHPS